jgi:hypothetical protein
MQNLKYHILSIHLGCASFSIALAVLSAPRPPDPAAQASDSPPSSPSSA